MMSTITFVPTQRGGTALIFDGYRYNKVRCNNDKNVTYWRCSKNRNCPGRAVTVDNRVKKTNNKHNHPPEAPMPHQHHHHHQLAHHLSQHAHQHHHNPFLNMAAAAAAAAAAQQHAAAQMRAVAALQQQQSRVQQQHQHQQLANNLHHHHHHIQHNLTTGLPPSALGANDLGESKTTHSAGPTTSSSSSASSAASTSLSALISQQLAVAAAGHQPSHGAATGGHQFASQRLHAHLDNLTRQHQQAAAQQQQQLLAALAQQQQADKQHLSSPTRGAGGQSGAAGSGAHSGANVDLEKQLDDVERRTRSDSPAGQSAARREPNSASQSPTGADVKPLLDKRPHSPASSLGSDSTSVATNATASVSNVERPASARHESQVRRASEQQQQQQQGAPGAELQQLMHQSFEQGVSPATAAAAHLNAQNLAAAMQQQQAANFASLAAAAAAAAATSGGQFSESMQAQLTLLGLLGLASPLQWSSLVHQQQNH